MGKISAPMVRLSMLRRAPCVWMGLSLARAQRMVLGTGFHTQLGYKAPVTTDLREDEVFVEKSTQANNHRPTFAEGDHGHTTESSDPTIHTGCTLLVGRLHTWKSGICANQPLVFLKALSRCLGLAWIIDASLKPLVLTSSKAKIIWASAGCALTCLGEVGPFKFSHINHEATRPSIAKYLTIKLFIFSKDLSICFNPAGGVCRKRYRLQPSSSPQLDIVFCVLEGMFFRVVENSFSVRECNIHKPCRRNAT